VSNEELTKKVVKEITKSGFPLELRVSRLLESNGYLLAHNLYYVDQDEGKGREMDLRALKNFEWKKGAQIYRVRHCLIVECKKSEKPWVVFTSAETYYDRKIHEIQRGGSDPKNKLGSSEALGIKEIHPFASYERRGRSYFEPLRKSGDQKNIFGALTTSAKATIATQGFASGERDLCFYYPLVVFQGTLYEAYLDDNNDMQVQEVDLVVTSFFYQSAEYKSEKFLIPIVTERALPNFCSDLDKVLRFYGDLMKN